MKSNENRITRSHFASSFSVRMNTVSVCTVIFTFLHIAQSKEYLYFICFTINFLFTYRL